MYKPKEFRLSHMVGLFTWCNLIMFLFWLPESQLKSVAGVISLVWAIVAIVIATNEGNGRDQYRFSHFFTHSVLFFFTGFCWNAYLYGLSQNGFLIFGATGSFVIFVRLVWMTVQEWNEKSVD